DDPTSAGKLRAVVNDLAAYIHCSGTLIIAMEKIWMINVPHIRDVLALEGLTLEDNPIFTVYLNGQTGRIPDGKKQDLPSHGAVALIAHKSPTYVCRPTGGLPRSPAN
ncbi:unnamed protein product, partial [Sphacelaria rigidula]